VITRDLDAAAPAALVALLRMQLHKFAPAAAPLDTVTAIAEDVWLIRRPPDMPIVAKKQLFGPLTAGMPYDLIAVEGQLLNLLHGAGCPVPSVLGTHADQQFIFTEYAGETTLDDWAQTAPRHLLAEMAGRLVQGCRRIDKAIAAEGDQLGHCVAPGCDHAALARNWEAAVAAATTALSWLLEGHGGRRQAALSCLGELASQCRARPPVLGTADYNPRNVVVAADGSPRFIEFATLSWDWAERRLAQYGTAVGSRDPAGHFVCLLSRQAAAEYAASGGDAQALDQHRLVLLLNAAHSLIRILNQVDDPDIHALARSWRRPEARLRQVLGLLARPVSDDPVAGALRQYLSAATTGRHQPPTGYPTAGRRPYQFKEVHRE
jgi:hypothetical protein